MNRTWTTTSAAPPSDPRPNKKGQEMKISYNTWAYSSFFVWVPAYTLDETIKRIARLGYDGIEIGAPAPHASPPHLGKERRKQVKDLLDEHGLSLSSMLP